MENKISGKQYKILWHFEGTTIEEAFVNEKDRDERYDKIKASVECGKEFIGDDEIIYNAKKVLFITKSAEDKYKYPDFYSTTKFNKDDLQ